MGRSPQDGVKILALNLLAAEKAVPTSVSAGTAPETRPDRIRPLPEPELPTSTPAVAYGPADRAEPFDVIGEAMRIHENAWQIVGKLEAEADFRGAVPALRACLEALDTLSALFRLTKDNNLTRASDAALLREVEHRKLKLEIQVRLLYEDDPPNLEVSETA
ncbi:MAG: hypothetical protein WA734_11095 [Candidatus Acidiferrales bacterium]